jgi:prepilin-type processing-associated H-X9-DG protein
MYGSLGLLVPKPVGEADQPYLPSPAVLFCPSDTVRAPFRQGPGGAQGFAIAPGVDNTNPYYMSYWYVYEPADASYYAGGTFPLGTAVLQRYRVDQTNAATLAIVFDQGNFEASVPMMNVSFHPSGMNILYLDGHVVFAVYDKLLPDISRKANLILALDQY